MTEREGSARLPVSMTASSRDSSLVILMTEAGVASSSPLVSLLPTTFLNLNWSTLVGQSDNSGST